MKKIVASIVTVLTVLLMCAVISACSSSDITGTYKFKSMSMTMEGTIVNIEAGQDYMGSSISEDDYTMEVKSDGTFVMTMKLMGDNDTQEGTWEEKDGKYYFTADGETIEGTLKGKELTLSMSEDGYSTTIVLKK